jgi:hypothetical protein
MRTCLFLTIAVLLHWSVPLRAQSATKVRGDLIGTWRLVSAEQRLSDGTRRPDPQPGPNGRGYLIYTEAGIMCAVLADPSRPAWASIAAPSDKEVRTAFDGLVSYCGRFEVNEAEGYVIHHIELDRVPNLAGTERKRFYGLQGNRLVLRAAPPLPAGMEEWIITWERVSH